MPGAIDRNAVDPVRRDPLAIITLSNAPAGTRRRASRAALVATNHAPVTLAEVTPLARIVGEYELAAVAKAPIATEAVRRIDQLFAIKRDINGRSADERRRARQEQLPPLVAQLEP